MRRKKPMFSLRVSVMRILVISMAALLTLAGTFLAYTMSQHHGQIEERDVEALVSAGNELARAYNNLRRAVNAIYSTGAFFEGAQAEGDGAEKATLRWLLKTKAAAALITWLSMGILSLMM